jgi:hypothetical protein
MQETVYIIVWSNSNMYLPFSVFYIWWDKRCWEDTVDRLIIVNGGNIRRCEEKKNSNKKRLLK